MADPVAVARKRSIAEGRLRTAVTAASKKFGVAYEEPSIQSRREPALASAHLVENVADFIERITQKER